MDAEKKRRLKHDYKERQSVGAVYALDCAGSGRRWIKSTPDIAGILNRYNFAVSIGSCPDPVLRAEWEKYGGESITLTVLEELKMKEEQTSAEFAGEIKLLRELWVEKAGAES